MLEDVKIFTELLVKHNITANQFYLCWLLYWDDKEIDADGRRKPEGDPVYKYYRMYAENVSGWSKNDVEHLIDIGFIVNPSSNKEFKLDMMEVGEKFKKEIVATRSDFEEFWDTYPTFVDNFNHPSGDRIKLKFVENRIYFRNRYQQIVKTKKLHRKIIKIVQWAKDEGLIKVNIEKFVASKAWEFFEEEMPEGILNDSSNRYGRTTRI